jgi:hypothetical protein
LAFDKLFLKVDEQGFVIDPVLLSDDKELPVAPDENHVEPYSSAETFFIPRYDRTTGGWVEGKLEEDLLMQAKSDKLAEMTAVCEEQILGYFEATVNTVAYLFSFDREAQQNFNGTLTFFSEGLITEVEWTVHLNDKVTRISMSKDQFMTVVVTAFSHKNMNISKLRNDIQPRIENAVTLEEVNAISWA